MNKLVLIFMILTLSSCMVSQKAYDTKCAEYDAQIVELESKARGMEMKEQLLREKLHNVITELKKLKDPNNQPPHDPAND